MDSAKILVFDDGHRVMVSRKTKAARFRLLSGMVRGPENCMADSHLLL
ncbi:MAG: hypothetical protein SWE60_05115 [Thermodesulfobacteriota bacterium]|nr:hypothetical protein [Thermodesulfobacteriota bacterium]